MNEYVLEFLRFEPIEGTGYKVIHFLMVIIGALISPSVKFLERLYVYIRDFRKEDFLEDEWHMYHYTVSNHELEFRSEILKISRSFTKKNSYKVSVYEENNSQKRPLFNGELRIVKSHYVFNMKTVSRNATEIIYMRTREISHKKESKICGAYTSYQFEIKIYNTNCIISREAMTEVDFKSYTNKHYTLHQENKLLVLK